MMEFESQQKWICHACNTVNTDNEVLKAKHPFLPATTVYGCPTCREIEELEGICSAKGCLSKVTTGLPTKSGYRWVCGKHAAMLRREEKNKP